MLISDSKYTDEEIIIRQQVSLLFVDLRARSPFGRCTLAFVRLASGIVADPIHKPTPAVPRAEPKDEIERFLAATIAKSSLWQKANRDQCLVTQSIRIALTRRN